MKLVQDSDHLEKMVITFPDMARSLKVTSESDLEDAADLLKGVKKLRQEAESVFRPLIKRAHETHKEALAALRRVDDPLQEAEGIVKLAVARYYAECEREEREERERLQREAMEREQEKRLERAIALEESGDSERAEMELDRPVLVPVVSTRQTQMPKALSTSTSWSAEVTDFMALVRHVAENPELGCLLQPVMPALNKIARAQKSTLAIPGVVAVKQRGVSVSTK
jgi:hypothetical protein